MGILYRQKLWCNRQSHSMSCCYLRISIKKTAWSPELSVNYVHKSGERLKILGYIMRSFASHSVQTQEEKDLVITRSVSCSVTRYCCVQWASRFWNFSCMSLFSSGMRASPAVQLCSYHDMSCNNLLNSTRTTCIWCHQTLFLLR